MAFFPHGPAPPSNVDPNDEVGAALEKCNKLEMVELADLARFVSERGPISVKDLPVRPFTATTHVRSIVDGLKDFLGSLDMPVVQQCLRDRYWRALPEILHPRVIPDHATQIKMTLVVISGSMPNKFTLAKHFDFDRLPVHDAVGLVHGEAFALRVLSPQPQLSKRAFLYVLQMMGGTQFVWHRFVDPSQDEKNASIDEGFDYTEKWPRTIQVALLFSVGSKR